MLRSRLPIASLKTVACIYRDAHISKHIISFMQINWGLRSQTFLSLCFWPPQLTTPKPRRTHPGTPMLMRIKLKSVYFIILKSTPGTCCDSNRPSVVIAVMKLFQNNPHQTNLFQSANGLIITMKFNSLLQEETVCVLHIIFSTIMRYALHIHFIDKETKT